VLPIAYVWGNIVDLGKTGLQGLVLNSGSGMVSTMCAVGISVVSMIGENFVTGVVG